MKLTKSLRNALTSPTSKRAKEPQVLTQGTQTSSGNAPIIAWQGERNSEGIPLRMICPISQAIMLDPVVASDGHTYDRPMILKVIMTGGRLSPMTREKLDKKVFSNGALQREVADFLEAQPQHTPQLSRAQKRALAQAVQGGVPKHHATAILLASDLPEDATAEAFLHEMPLASRPATQQTSIPPGHPGSGVAAPRRLPATHAPTADLTHLNAMTSEWHAALDDAVRQAAQSTAPLPMRRLPGFADLNALQNIGPSRLAAVVGARPRPDSLRSESSESVQSSRRASQDSEVSFDFLDTFLESYRNEPEGR